MSGRKKFIYTLLRPNNPQPTTMASIPMNKDQVFNAEFIQLVKAHPCLYNWNLAEYKQAQNQEKAWEEVAKHSNDKGWYIALGKLTTSDPRLYSSRKC
jgi:Alcohol dehydrogenase transcription factor Myb/SANT-like